MEELRKLGEHFIGEGGCLEEDGKVKSCELFLDFESHKELDEYLTNEPYVIEKMWDKIEIEVIEN